MRLLTEYFPASDRPQVQREVTQFKELAGGLFVPLRGRTAIYSADPEFGDQPAAEYLLEVDEAMSRWNVDLDATALREMKLPAGTTVNDGLNQRSFVVGETSVPKNLDKLAEQATEVLFGSLEPKPEPYNWYLLGGGAVALLLFIAIALYLRRRGRYA